MPMPTVADYLVSRLAQLGITEYFGLPGDYNFNLVSAVEQSSEAKWIGCCNELNAGYAADGYARLKGVGAVLTTMGVGELSAINAIAGAYAEFLPVFKIVGSPASAVQASGALTHHTLGNGDYDVYQRMYAEVTAAQAKLTAENAASEIERLIEVAMTQRRPVYVNVPSDVCLQPIAAHVPQFSPAPSNPMALQEAAGEILNAIENAKRPVVIIDAKVARFGVQAEAKRFIEKANLPVATLVMGKGIFDEQHPNFIGTYDGKLIQPETCKLVEDADLLIALGCVLTDGNSAAFTVKCEPQRTISLQENHVDVHHARYHGVHMADLLGALTNAVATSKQAIRQTPSDIPHSDKSGSSEAMTFDYLLSQTQTFIQSGDTLVVETGTIAEGTIQFRLPNDVQYQSQVLWGSIGYATAATLGAGLAAPERRLLLLTGEGSHQLTAQALGSMHRFGLKPIIILLNNNGYTIERYLCEDPMDPFNEVGIWNYTKLPAAFGANDAFVATVRTKKEFDQALEAAASCDQLAYIEVVLETMDAPEVMRKIRDSRSTLYGSSSETNN